jgi:hypothetical protein
MPLFSSFQDNRTQYAMIACMATMQPAGPQARGSSGEEGRIQLYGWDSRTETWNGPTGLSFSLRASRRLLRALQAAPGRSWYGPVNCGAPGEAPTRFFSLIHALSDCAVAMIYCNDSRSGPVEIVAVIPPNLHARLRPDFAFEFVAFARFLGALNEKGALTVHDLMAASIREAQLSEALIFSISTGLWPSDLDHVLSSCVEKIALSMLEWIAER